METREFIEFVVNAVKWVQRIFRLLDAFHERPLSRDWRDLHSFNFFENSEGQMGFAIDWECDGKHGDEDWFVVTRLERE